MNDSYFNDIKNSPTLAPLKELYQTKNISQKDAGILASISKNTVTSIESTIGALTHLIQNLKIYKETVVDSINLQAESLDISTKYGNDVPKQSHSLPGIVTLPQSYDLNDIRSDNDRMMQVSEEKKKAMSQKEVYMKMCSEDVRIFLQSWKRLNANHAQFDVFIESMDDSLNPSY
jgi:Ni,Fe-hydrogenase I large subunit